MKHLTIVFMLVALACGGCGTHESANHAEATPENDALRGFVIVQPSQEQETVLAEALPRLVFVRQRQQPCENIEGAVALIWDSLSIAHAGFCTEYKGYFWFSRLDRASDDRTFESGFAVKKGTAEIYHWEKPQPNQSSQATAAPRLDSERPR